MSNEETAAWMVAEYSRMIKQGRVAIGITALMVPSMLLMVWVSPPMVETLAKLSGYGVIFFAGALAMGAVHMIRHDRVMKNAQAEVARHAGP